MIEKVSFEEAGKRVSGRYIVKDGMVIVTAFDGCTTTGVIEDSMLSPETWQRRFCFNCTDMGRRTDDQ